MPIGLPELIHSDGQPWSSDENYEEIRLAKPEACPECGTQNEVIGRYFYYRRTAMYVEDVCEKGCLINRKRVKYTK